MKSLYLNPRDAEGKSRPTLLLLSRCVPSAVGNARRARAWQLLKLAALSHRVSLVCAVDGPVSLDQWRSVHKHVEHLLLEPLSEVLLLSRRPGQHRRGSAAAELISKHTFDAVMTTDAALWAVGSQLDSPLRICDLDSEEHMKAPGIASRLFAWNGRINSRGLRERDAAIEEANLLTVSHAESDALTFARHKTVVLSHGIDEDYFPGDETMALSSADRPILALHGDWSRPDSRRRIGGLFRRIWPVIRRAVPDALMSTTYTHDSADARHALKQADVVVSPDPDPLQARWPILQAMALRRAVVAPRAVAQALGVNDGEHLFAPSREAEWIDHCVRSLRDARLRLNLARAGRSFVERHCLLERLGDEVSTTLLGGGWRSPELRTAA